MVPAKGQAGIEMLMSIAFALFLLIIVALFANERNREADAIKLRMDAKRVATSLADNIDTIAEQGPGFYRYFSIPQTLYGITDYNISIYQDYVEIWTTDYAWSTQTVSSNVTTHCLDKGYLLRNKVYNDNESINIICNKPELRFYRGSMWPRKTRVNTTINVSIRVLNFGPVDSGPFNVSFNGTKQAAIASIESDRSAEVIFQIETGNVSGSYPMEVYIDPANEVNESIESNNRFNITLNVE